MQLANGISRRYVILFSAGLIFLWLWLAMDEDRRLPKSIAWAIGRPVSTPQNDVFNHPVLDSWELREICSSTDWNSSLIFTCDDNQGGVGRVRNSILNCVRFAIGAGGGLVLPQIRLRDVKAMVVGEEDEEGDDRFEKRHGLGREGMDYMFDKNHFVDSLMKSCPELVLVRHMDSTSSNRRRSLRPESLFTNIPASGIEEPGEWPVRLRMWINKYMPSEPTAEPIIIDLEQSFLHYPIHSDGSTLAWSFGDILKFRPDVRHLATSVLKGIAHSHDSEDGTEVQLYDVSSAIINPSFIGVHLGTENPLAERHVVDITYSHYQAQAAVYIEQATTGKIPIMYVASGNLPEVLKLAQEAQEWNVEVTHKEDLLQGKQAEALMKLRWDQRALVDYLVLLKGQEFAGIGHSSFSWNVMLKRHELGEGASATLAKGVYRDKLSTLYGVRNSYVESSGCMWP